MNKPYETVSQIMAERDQLRAELATLKAWQGEAVAYAYEYGKDNGDGSFSVTITRGQIPSYLTPVKDWPVKPLYLSPPVSTDAVLVPVEQRELEWLEHWLLFASEPVGQECCNRPGSECCGCPDPCYRTADDIATEMNARHAELRALLAQTESKG